MSHDPQSKLPHSAVLYAGPSRSETPKACPNCMMFLKDVSNCSILGERVRVGSQMVCGHHIDGQPMTSKDHPPKRHLDPDAAGLVGLKQLHGTRCGTCAHYQAPYSCKVVQAPIHPYGCCAGWTNPDEELAWQDMQDVRYTEKS